MFNSKKKFIQTLRTQWGKENEQYHPFDLISILFDYKKENTNVETVDERTWTDLNLDSFFAKIDRCKTNVGKQYLYSKLKIYENDKERLNRDYSFYKTLIGNSNLREELQFGLKNLSSTDSYFIPHIIFSKDLPYTPFYRLFYILSFVTLCSTALIAIQPKFLLLTLALLLTNVILNKIFSKKIYEYFSGFSGLNDLLITAKKIIKINAVVDCEVLTNLKNSKDVIKKVSKKLGNFVIDKTSMSELMLAAIEYMNMFFLFDIIAYYRSVKTMNKHKEEIKIIYENVAKLDASISIASYLFENNKYTQPTYSGDGKLSFRELFHPLVEDAIANSLDDQQYSVLITGSNMSGKTTFIKTLGINCLLAQTLGFVHAEELCLPDELIVKSAIKREEDLENSKSYFFVEIEELQDFINYSQNGKKYLFLIDEIFRGTNTVERLAASTSVLNYLDRKNYVFVTTHDIELQHLLEDRFKMFHFSEKVKDDNYYFDYKINTGPCTSGNAIKLLEIKNYPKSVTDEARELVKKLSAEN